MEGLNMMTQMAGVVDGTIGSAWSGVSDWGEGGIR